MQESWSTVSGGEWEDEGKEKEARRVQIFGEGFVSQWEGLGFFFFLYCSI